MNGPLRLHPGWPLAAAAVLLVAVFALVSDSTRSDAPPFAPGTRVEGSHSDALLILHNLGQGSSLRANSPGGGSGIVADSEKNDGVVGRTNDPSKAGLSGSSKNGVGVSGRSDTNDGVVGVAGAKGKSGVWGHSVPGVGVTGSSTQSDGVVGSTLNANRSGVFGRSADGIGVTAQSTNGTALLVDGTSVFKKYASFEGGHGDLAENYYGAGELEPGDVVVLDASAALTVRRASRADDPAVAGVLSTAPAMKLQGRIADERGVPLVIAGRALCKVDAAYGRIRPGTLLTSSATPGHAMRAAPITVGGIEIYRPGTLLGKALEPLEEGRGKILILVILQ